ncbi:aminotransferase class I/II-fold pyridoxal phosphate-dependent enzyme [Abyssisolibacter fermentans]|uniref:methionine gamma-lyase family protein n=1 Tax=Abyssisolibacter fermentans TaxID=1766203 RepID=UPI000833D765|nr:aminotransferase class I/II-fold pyridoxal phosphate-dependent enzyme [Abyssisolibacter fermentans]
MNSLTRNILCKQFDIDNSIIDYVLNIEKDLKHLHDKINATKEYNQFKVLSAFQDANLAATHFNWTTGYGYDDEGRDKVEEIYAKVFNAQDALVRANIASGTHALSLTLGGILRPNDEMLSITGLPYDTMQKVIGIKGNMKGSLKEYNITYNQVNLIENNKIDINATIEAITDITKLILIQRSTGYSDRKAVEIDNMKEAIKAIKEKKKDIIVMVDNCYGEFVETIEPTDVGADIIAGSLIKNPGGGLALAGGYVVGKKDLIEAISNRLTAPGIGKDCGLTYGTSRLTLQGLFLAPHVVSEALKGAILSAGVFDSLGFNVLPAVNDKRSDIIQAIEFNDPEKVVKFCQGIQSASPVDSFVLPLPWDMPGYSEPVIMAAGAFIQGSSIELSADAPMRTPYWVYLQGGLTYEHCKLGIMKGLNNLLKNKLIDKNKLNI